MSPRRHLPDLPTSAGDWRLMGRTTRLVLGSPTYASLALLGALAGLTLFVVSLNAQLVLDLVVGGRLPLSRRLGVLVNLYPVVSPTAFGPVESAVLLATAALVGSNLALVTYHLREHAGPTQGGSGSVVGVVLGTFGAGCAACGSAVLAGLLSTLGIAGGLAVLPLEGLEFAVAAVAALVLSLYWVADGMRGAEVRGCPVDT